MEGEKLMLLAGKEGEAVSRDEMLGAEEEAEQRLVRSRWMGQTLAKADSILQRLVLLQRQLVPKQLVEHRRRPLKPLVTMPIV